MKLLKAHILPDNSEKIITRNKRIAEVLDALSDEKFLERIASYKELHDRWERASIW